MLATYITPLRTMFRGLTSRDALLVKGPAGWGEFGPFWEYGDAESLAWLHAAHEAAFLGWPAPRRTAIGVNVTVPAVGPDDVASIVGTGFRTAKVKVAARGADGALEAVGAEIERVAAVRDALGPAGRIRVDANAAWSLDDAVAHLRDIDRAAGGLEYAEQPCATVADLAALRRRLDIPIAADESIRRAQDPLAVVRAGAADVLVLKVAPLGGVRACLELADRTGLPVVVSSALESSVGIAAGLALAAALPELPYDCGLATVRLFTADVTSDPLIPVNGSIVLRDVEPDTLVPAPPDLDARWRSRLARVAALARPGELAGIAELAGVDSAGADRADLDSARVDPTHAGPADIDPAGSAR